MDKLITVVIPTFDRLELTRKAIESVTAEYFSLLEIVVVDDFGTVPFTYTDSQNMNGIDIRVIRLPVNSGPGIARMRGTEVANGKYIAFLDSDDVYDPEWLNCVVLSVQGLQGSPKRIAIVGIANGERLIGAMVRKLLFALPRPFQLGMSRFVATMFNPFYMPTVVIPKDSCRFLNGLRYCEDYYTIATAVFLVDGLVLINAFACHLGREPNSSGGLSASTSDMHQGEMRVRKTMLKLRHVPILYKFFLPLGMLYQQVRSLIKTLLEALSR